MNDIALVQRLLYPDPEPEMIQDLRIITAKFECYRKKWKKQEYRNNPKELQTKAIGDEICTDKISISFTHILFQNLNSWDEYPRYEDLKTVLTKLEDKSLSNKVIQWQKEITWSLYSKFHQLRQWLESHGPDVRDIGRGTATKLTCDDIEHYLIIYGNVELFGADSERQIPNKRAPNSLVSMIMARTLTRSSLKSTRSLWTTGFLWTTISPLIQPSPNPNESQCFQWCTGLKPVHRMHHRNRVTWSDSMTRNPHSVFLDFEFSYSMMH